jgi:hypothetical protein
MTIIIIVINIPSFVQQVLNYCFADLSRSSSNPIDPSLLLIVHSCKYTDRRLSLLFRFICTVSLIFTLVTDNRPPFPSMFSIPVF